MLNLKMLSMQYRKNKVEHTQKRMSITSYIKIYTYVIFDENDSNKNDSINSVLQYGRVVNKNCYVVFPASGFPYLILCPRQFKRKVATT